MLVVLCLCLCPICRALHRMYFFVLSFVLVCAYVDAYVAHFTAFLRFVASVDQA